MLYFKIEEYKKITYYAPIRTKYDLLLIIIEALQCMLIDPSSDNTIRLHSDSFFILHKNKFSRLFFILDKKIFSIRFPFTYILNEEKSKIKDIHYNGKNIDIGIVSYLREALTKLSDFYNTGKLYYINESNDLIHIDDESYDIKLIYEILNNLLMMEDGYIRYDHDENRQNGKLHPLYHYDIFYESGNTFKIGLTKKINVENLIDFLDITTDCHYIK